MHMIKQRFLMSVLLFFMILGTWKGYVALFEKDAQEPRQIFPCPVSALPEADQQALEQRIPIRNDRDLQKILEDYLS